MSSTAALQSAHSSSRWRELERHIAELCARTTVVGDPTAMARELSALVPDSGFREALVRGGWYRLGGVIDGAGKRIVSDIDQWAEAELAAHGGDFQALAESHAGEDLRSTRLIGKTHYWVATIGRGATEFLQVEIEEFQEVMGPPLFDGDELPSSIEELVDGCSASRPDRGEPIPLGIRFYSLRRVTDVAEFLERMRAQKPEPQAVHRFCEGWDNSSAGATSQFANHWILAVREHLDHHRQPILQAAPVPALNGVPPRFEGAFGVRGLALHQALQQFDRQAGYPMAWFFHMLTTKAVPHAVAAAVVEDMQSGFRYLPERDVDVIKGWLRRPYGF